MARNAGKRNHKITIAIDVYKLKVCLSFVFILSSGNMPIRTVPIVLYLSICPGTASGHAVLTGAWIRMRYSLVWRSNFHLVNDLIIKKTLWFNFGCCPANDWLIAMIPPWRFSEKSLKSVSGTCVCHLTNQKSYRRCRMHSFIMCKHLQCHSLHIKS